MAPPKRGLSYSDTERSRVCLKLPEGQHHGIDADAHAGEALGRQIAPLVAPIAARGMLCGPCPEPLMLGGRSDLGGRGQDRAQLAARRKEVPRMFDVIHEMGA